MIHNNDHRRTNGFAAGGARFEGGAGGRHRGGAAPIPGVLRRVGPGLMIFGASWAGVSLIGAAFDDYKLTAGTAIVSSTALARGFTLHQIFKAKRVKLGERRRLRAVEVPVTPVIPGLKY